MIRYQTDASDISARQLRGFFVGWPNPPSPDTHLTVLQKSDYVVLAIDDAGGDVVGYITAITDHVLCAYIPFLEVLPAYQFRGIGSELVTRMLVLLKGFYMIDLMTAPKLQRGYATFGFTRCPGMTIRNFAAQSGRLPETDNDQPA